MNWTAVGAMLLALAVGLGAFGAHALKNHLDAYRMGVWEKAVFYHFVHALGVLVVGVMGKVGMLTPEQAGRVSLLLVAGVALFSGSLYLLAWTGLVQLGAVTPLGGVAFIAAWVWLAAALLRRT